MYMYSAIIEFFHGYKLKLIKKELEQFIRTQSRIESKNFTEDETQVMFGVVDLSLNQAAWSPGFTNCLDP